MTRPVITCRPRDTLNSAAGLMWEYDCGALPVVDGDGVVIAMLTDRDVCMAAHINGKSLDDLLVSTAMSKTLHTCLPTDSVTDAEKLLARAQVRRLPVVDGQGHPVGLLSLGDIARATGKQEQKGALTTLAAVSAPRRQPAA